MEAGGLLPRQPPGTSDHHHQQQQQQLQQQQQQHQQQIMGQAPGLNDPLTPKRQAVVERLRRRIEGYRKRHLDVEPKFDQSYHGFVEQNNQETLVLKQRYLDSKAKRQKKPEKKQPDNVGLQSIHVQQKFLKRTADELESGGGGGGGGGVTESGGFGEPSVKLQCTQSTSATTGQGPNGNAQGGASATGSATAGSQNQQGPGSQGGSSTTGTTTTTGATGTTTEGLTKFSVEIVQQLEFTTSAANSQAQQISTNVTVKALTNASVKSDLVNATASPKSEPNATASTNTVRVSNGSTVSSNVASNNNSNGNNGTQSIATSVSVPTSADIISSLVECKQEPDNDYSDLDQCAPSFNFDVGFMGDETADDDAIKEILSDIQDFHPILSQLDYVEHDVKPILLPQQQQQHPQQQVMDSQVKLEDDKDQAMQQQSMFARMPPYMSSENLQPAAQTLKQMAEQHQHKTLGFGQRRSPYADQFAGDAYQPFYKNNGGFQPDVFAQRQQQQQQQQQQQAAANKANILGAGAPGYKQQYSPYGSPGSAMPNHGSPGYPLPPRISQAQAGPQGGQGSFNSSTPPRPPSGPGATNIQINQAQQLHINNPTHQIQVSAGQHMQLTSELKPSGNVSVAAQQAMYFNQQQQKPQSQAQPQGQPQQNTESTYCSVSQSQTINFTQQTLRQRAQQQQQQQQQPRGAPPQQQQQQQQPPPQQQQQQQPPQQQQQVPPQQQPQQQQQQQQPPPAAAPNQQMSNEQHMKLMQQQQMMRVQQVMQQQQQQQQQQQHMAAQGMGAGMVRPPPPEYKAAQAQLMHGGMGMAQAPRFSNAAPMRRVAQQPIPPSGPMMRPQMGQQSAMHAAGNTMYMNPNGPTGPAGNMNMGPAGAGAGGMGGAIGSMHQMQQRLGYPRTNNQRPPNVNLGLAPDGLNNGINPAAAAAAAAARANNQNWQQQLFMQQQQQQQHQANFGIGGGGGMQMNAAQMQHQQMMRTQGGGVMGAGGMPNPAMQQQIVASQQQHQQANNQMGMQMQMSQAQSVSSVVPTGNNTGSPLHPHQQFGAGSPGARNVLQSQLPPPQQQQQQPQQADGSANDLSFDFLDNLQAETSNFNAQELLNSLGSSDFSLDGIL